MEKILLVEDSPEFQLLVSRMLNDSFDVTCVGQAKEAMNRLANQDYDLVLLDISLPDGDGFKVCSEIRNHPKTGDMPVMFLTGKSNISDKIHGFSMGADDYIVKPFDPLELKARIQARINRNRSKATTAKAGEETIHEGSLKLSIPRQKAYLLEEGKETDLNLTPIEFKLLYFFIRNADKTFNRDEILGKVWGGDMHIVNRTIDKHICSLRQKLGAKADFIRTISRKGYCFSIKSA